MLAHMSVRMRAHMSVRQACKPSTAMADEIYVQLMKQLSKNDYRESKERGNRHRRTPHMRVGMRVDMRVAMRVDMCVDMRVDMRVDVWLRVSRTKA